MKQKYRIMNKSNYFKGLCVAAALLATSLGAQAQQTEISVYVNGNLPVAEFNNGVEGLSASEFVPMDRTNIATGATAGLGATGRFGMWFDVGMGQLLPYAEASFFWNASKSGIRDIYEDNTLNTEYNERPVSPTYFNIPIMIGIQYRYDLTDIFKVFGELSLGYDAYLITASGWKDDEFLPFYKYNVGGALCWQVGVGSFFGTHVSAGLHYYGLGKHNIDLNKHSNNAYMGGNDIVAIPANVDDGSTVVSRRIGSLMLRIGFHF